MAKPLSDHLTALAAMREDVESLLRTPDVRSDAIDKLARARIAISEAANHLREAYALTGQRKTA